MPLDGRREGTVGGEDVVSDQRRSLVGHGVRGRCHEPNLPFGTLPVTVARGVRHMLRGPPHQEMSGGTGDGYR